MSCAAWQAASQWGPIILRARGPIPGGIAVALTLSQWFWMRTRGPTRLDPPQPRGMYDALNDVAIDFPPRPFDEKPKVGGRKVQERPVGRDVVAKAEAKTDLTFMPSRRRLCRPIRLGAWVGVLRRVNGVSDEDCAISATGMQPSQELASFVPATRETEVPAQEQDGLPSLVVWQVAEIA